jgi:hypothetical protein
MTHCPGSGEGKAGRPCFHAFFPLPLSDMGMHTVRTGSHAGAWEPGESLTPSKTKAKVPKLQVHFDFFLTGTGH